MTIQSELHFKPTIMPAKQIFFLYEQNPSKLTPTTLPPHSNDQKDGSDDQQYCTKACNFLATDQQHALKTTRIHISPITNGTAPMQKLERSPNQPVGSKSAGGETAARAGEGGAGAGTDYRLRSTPGLLDPSANGIVAGFGRRTNRRSRPNPNQEGKWGGEKELQLSGTSFASPGPIAPARPPAGSLAAPSPPVPWGERRRTRASAPTTFASSSSPSPPILA